MKEFSQYFKYLNFQYFLLEKKVLAIFPMMVFVVAIFATPFSYAVSDTRQVETICSLTIVGPYYNCSEKWSLIPYDEELPGHCNENIATGLASKACTRYTKYGSDVISADIHLGTLHGDDTIFPYPSGPDKQSVLYHELKHAVCGCTWHTEIANDFIN